MAKQLWENSSFGTRSFFHPDHRKGQDEKVLKIRHLSTTADETDYLFISLRIVNQNKYFD